MKIALITGASSGIGREFALQIGKSRRVDEIWVVARREDRLRELAGRVQVPVRALPWDMLSPSFLPALQKLLERERPQIRFLVNCAGFGKFGNYREISQKDCRDMVELNCKALMSVTQMALPYLCRGSRILQMGSTSAFQPLPRMAVYAASKAFVVSYSRALALELRPRGITVTAVCPGWVDTDFFRVAKHSGNPSAVHRFAFVVKPGPVVEKAMRDSALGRDLSVYGAFNQLHRAAAKLLPQKAIAELWDKLQGL